jgi:hypothetical protein
MGGDLGERGAAKRNGVEPLKDVVHVASEFLMKYLAARSDSHHNFDCQSLDWSSQRTSRLIKSFVGHHHRGTSEHL